jgi:adenosylmethionine-8-amino-7-oxononanoate aminotransferase
MATISTFNDLIERDLNTVWHPFTQMQAARLPIPIHKAEGVYLYDLNDRRYIDAISSWWVNLHGHAHPYIVKKIKSQAEQLEHVIFADFTHIPQ